MTKDKELEDLFLSLHPHFDDKEKFMAQIERKLDAVEYLRQYEKTNLRHYKYAIVAAFVMGVIASSTMFAFILSIPEDVPLITFNASSGILHSIEMYSRPFATTLLSALICFGIVSIIYNAIDIAKMKMYINDKENHLQLDSK